MKLKTLADLPSLIGKKVFVRVDFNAPFKDGVIQDDRRIRHALPTLNYLLDHGVSQIVLGTHFGRPKDHEPHLKTNLLADTLSSLVARPVKKVDDWGENGLPQDSLIMLENLRFHPAEKSKSELERDQFGRQLAGLVDVYVNEAFSNSHREHASMTSVPKFVSGYAGLGVEREVSAISSAIQNPKHPLVAVIGGLKADKLTAIARLLPIADHVLVAGALACSLLKARGYEIGDSKADDEGMEEYSDLVEGIVASDKICLPTDFIVADSFSETAQIKTVLADVIEPGWMALDIGPQSINAFETKISTSQTVLWFGPIGVFEMKPFSNGTKALGQAIASNQGFSIIGGGDSANAVRQLGLEAQMSLVSTGGGASLKMIEGETLPALDILTSSDPI